MRQAYFMTGTDTNAGKTVATLALMHYFQQQGYSVVGMKPVAAGCVWTNSLEGGSKGQWQNEDALLMQSHATVALPYALINPYAYEEPVSPHLAGVDNPVDCSVLKARFEQLKERADIVLVEGAGGWYAPLNAQQDISDLAKALSLPVILVVGIKLGCINHAKLTYQALLQSGLPCAGWLAVCLDKDMLKQTENIQTLKQALTAPLLGILPYSEPVDYAGLATYITGPLF